MRKCSKMAIYIAATALSCCAASAYTLTFDDIPLGHDSLLIYGDLDSYNYIATPAYDQYPFDRLRGRILQGVIGQP